MRQIDQQLHCPCRNQLSLTPLFDAEGVCTHYVAVQQDVTARKASEAATQMRDFALSTLSEGICMVDPTTAGQPLVYVNEAFCRMTGYSKEECLGRNARFMQVRPSWLAYGGAAGLQPAPRGTAPEVWPGRRALHAGEVHAGEVHAGEAQWAGHELCSCRHCRNGLPAGGVQP